jgi:hypothetical protein
VLAKALLESKDNNPLVKDVKLSKDDQKQCSNAVGAIVDVGGECWQHTNNDQLSVYDFTLFAMDHEGNRESAGFWPIKGVALRGESILHFPSSHPLSRWESNSGGSWTAIKSPIGRLGDIISFDDLPRRIQSAGFAAAVGVGVSAAPQGDVAGIEMCGSPGEVANDPAQGQRYYFGKNRWDAAAPYTQQEMLKNYEMTGANKKQAVHTTIALQAPDQLRQKTAWALSQVFVVGEFSSAVLNDHGEVWTR